MPRLCFASVSVALIFTIAACDRASDRSMLIAPFLQGSYYCAGAEEVPTNLTEDDAARYCADRHLTGASRIEAALAKIGPSVSPSGKYQLGYTLVVPLMRYFEQHDGRWELNREALRNGLSTVSGVDRKVVIYLSANHFTDSGITLSAELAHDPANLMWTRSGPMFPDNYFGHPIIGWTLTDSDAPITRMRKEVFKAAIDELCQLPRESRNRIAAVSVLGEIHQLYPGFVDGPRYGVSIADATDYSPKAVEGFRQWLLDRFKTVDALNRHVGSSYASFGEVVPPSKDMRTEKVNSSLEHLDNYAAGSLPVYGWLNDKTARALRVLVRVDGAPVGQAETGLSRTDVTDAVPTITDPNIGFKYVLDFTKLAAGWHTLDVVVKTDRKELLVGRRAFVVGSGSATPAVAPSAPAAPMAEDSALAGYLDGPADNTSVIFNPVAQLWLEYRSVTVTKYLESFATIAQDSCLPKEKIFSHQITPNLTGSWNGDLIAVDDVMRRNSLFNPGATLYGGAAFGSAFLRMKEQLGWDRYGVSEMHPVTKLNLDGYRSMFEMHRKSGAVFVAPYYVVITPNPDLSSGGLTGFMLTPKNPKAGSVAFYEAIVDAMNKQ